MSKISVILVDDHKIFRMGIRSLLMTESNIEVLDEAGEADTLFKTLEEKIPDIILLDISLPEKTGIEVTRILSQKYPEIKVLIMSADKNDYSVTESIKAGAKAYLHKDSSKEELLTAIHAVMNGEEYFGQSISQTVFRCFVNKVKGEMLAGKGTSNSISDREIEIIRAVCDGLSYKEISDHLKISPRTVESHKTRIMKKLGLHSTAGLVKFAIKNNIVELN